MDTLILAVAVAAVIVVAAAGALAVLRKRRAEDKGAQVVRRAIQQYFKKLGATVTVECRRSGRKSYTAYIESEPIKQLRLSAIIETSLRDQLHNLHHLELDKVYWRFPLKDGDDLKADARDEYITEGLAHTRYLPRVQAEETSWATFEEAGKLPPRKAARAK